MAIYGCAVDADEPSGVPMRKADRAKQIRYSDGVLMSVRTAISTIGTTAKVTRACARSRVYAGKQTSRGTGASCR